MGLVSLTSVLVSGAIPLTPLLLARLHESYGQVGDGGDNLEKRFFIFSLTGRMRLSFFVLLLRWMISDSDIAIKAGKWPNRQSNFDSTPPNKTKGVASIYFGYSLGAF